MIYLETLSVFKSKNKKSDLEKFCNNHLAYLIDSGYDVSVKKHSGIYPLKSAHYSIEIFKKENDTSFKWNDIKYDFIPFLEILIDNYEVSNKKGMRKKNILDIEFQEKRIVGDTIQDYRDYYTKEEILSDKVRVDIDFFKLKLKVK
jgi:hypothetical protein